MKGAVPKATPELFGRTTLTISLGYRVITPSRHETFVGRGREHFRTRALCSRRPKLRADLDEL